MKELRLMDARSASSGQVVSRRQLLTRAAFALGLGAISLDLLTACTGPTATGPTQAGAPTSQPAAGTPAGAAPTAAAVATQTAPAQSGAAQEIIVGVPVPLTGAFSEAGQNCLQGVQHAVDDINQAGGVNALNGAKLRISYGDTSTDNPAQAADVVRRLVGEGASALIGAYLSSLTLPASTAAEQAEVPLITQSFVDTLSTRGYKYFFQLPPKSSAFGTATVDYLLEIYRHAGINLTSGAMISSDDASSKAQGEAVIEQAKAKGMEMPVAEFYPVTIADMTPQVQKVRSSKVQAVFMTGPVPAVLLFARTLRGLGDKTPIVGIGGGGILDVSSPGQLGPAADGVIALAAWNWDLNQPGVDKVAKAYNDRNKVPFMPQESGESYIAAWLIHRAVENTKSS